MTAPNGTTTRLLLIECPDEVGLVHRITGVLYRAGFSIVSNHEFVDPSARHFFMRTAFIGRPRFRVDRRGAAHAAAGARHGPHRIHRAAPIVVLATREPHCLGDLLLRHAEGDIPARIQAVVSNYDTLRRLFRALRRPLSPREPRGTRRAPITSVRCSTCWRQYAPDHLVLAKYMRVLSPDFIARYPGRIVNIHHSFLPAFVGARPYQQAFDRGVKIIGATATSSRTIWTRDLIIAQDVQPVTHAHTAADMARAGRDVEKSFSHMG